MSQHFVLYLKTDSVLHRLDPRAKLTAVVGFVGAVAFAPLHPFWSIGLLALLLLAAAFFARIPGRMLGRRLLPLLLVIGGPFVLSRFGGEQTRFAGEMFAIKSFLIAASFVVLLATTKPAILLEIPGRFPGLTTIGQLGEAILRGSYLLAEEVTRTNRAWRLRAPKATLKVRLTGLIWASISLITRAAVRSGRIGAAMVLRGFQGRLPISKPTSLSLRQLAAGVGFGLLALVIAGAGRWL